MFVLCVYAVVCAGAGLIATDRLTVAACFLLAGLALVLAGLEWLRERQLSPARQTDTVLGQVRPFAFDGGDCGCYLHRSIKERCHGPQ